MSELSIPNDEYEEENVISRARDFFRSGVTRLQEGAEDVVLDFRNFWRSHFHSKDEHPDGEQISTDPDDNGTDGGIEISEAETKIKYIVENISTVYVDEIEDAVTAENLCLCQNPVTTAFEVSTRLRELALSRDESAVFLNTLAEQVEDFSVTLMDQVNSKEEISIEHEKQNMDTYASLLDGITESAIRFSQKKFVSHPLAYRLLNQRWNYGLPSQCLPGKKLRLMLYIFTILDTILTPVLFPVITYAFYKDQTVCPTSRGKREDRSLRDMYLDYLTTPFVIFLKDKLSQVVFIALHFRMCILPSSVAPRTEEFLILIFYVGLLLSEFQQYHTSQSRVYLRNMWNYVDVATLTLHALIFFLRIASITRGGDPYHNRLLEVVNYLYGINTLLLVLRFSSILEVNKTVGPLQLALFRMCIDLVIILVQFVFVIVAFSVAITMAYTAEMSYLTPTRQQENNGTQLINFCAKGTSACLFKASTHLIWSVFGLTELETMESHDQLTAVVVGVLYVMFLILSVIMLVNMLVALLTNTYNKVETNADVEWKFSRAVVADEYRRYHPIVVPFNIISVPLSHCYIKIYGDNRAKKAQNRRKIYEKFYNVVLFPTITKRYLEKHGDSFPMSIDAKVDLLHKDMKKIMEKLDVVLSRPHGNQAQEQFENRRQHLEEPVYYHSTV
ncbi:short transient receptor potential channel 5-like [Oculina patagonica]